MSSPRTTKKTVLITGCSDGSIGAALAVSFHNAGLHVYATSRNTSKMSHLSSLGIQTFELNTLSSSSISSAVSKIPHLDILVNNAGGFYAMPFSDIDISKAKELFDLNVWSYLEVTQAFLPLLIASRGMVVNQTSVLSVLNLPFHSAYTASKAAMAMFSNAQRLELEPFGVKVIELKTSWTKSNTIQGAKKQEEVELLPKGSMYNVAKEAMEACLEGKDISKGAMETSAYGEVVVGELLKIKVKPVVWVCETFPH